MNEGTRMQQKLSEFQPNGISKSREEGSTKIEAQDEFM
jgi:hypothetical protein